MVVVAQLVRAPDCGSGGRRFETDLPPRSKRSYVSKTFFLYPKKVYSFEYTFSFNLKQQQVYRIIASQFLYEMSH